jgi:ATP/ADP translocase
MCLLSWTNILLALLFSQFMFSSTTVSEAEKKSFAVLMTLAISIAGLYAAVQAAQYSIAQVKARRAGMNSSTTAAPASFPVNMPMSPSNNNMAMTITSNFNPAQFTQVRQVHVVHPNPKSISTDAQF